MLHGIAADARFWSCSHIDRGAEADETDMPYIGPPPKAVRLFDPLLLS